jgi:peptidoglycan hydrolase-like protein with peptidoglycan-binding domain
MDVLRTRLMRRVSTGVVVLAGMAALTLAEVPAALASAPPPTVSGAPISLESSSCPSNIVQGDSGSCVSALQQLLNTYGANIAVDGSFGSATASAVENFQTQAGIGVDGQVGPTTKSTLYGNSVLPVSLESSSCPSNMVQGNTGACVEVLQGLLDLYGANISVDGSFGPATASAVENFQTQAGIGVDGQVGPQTKSTLYSDGAATPFSLEASSCPSNIVQGDSGACVAVLQELLNYYGQGLSVDGSFGPLTATAVENFQRQAGIGVDGQVGPTTKSNLYSRLGTSTTTPPPTGSGNGCAAADNCSPQGFADAVLTYPGIGAPVTASNEYALQVWEMAEGGGAGCPGQPARTAPWSYSPGPAGNPLNTTQSEPGDSDWNSVGVKVFANASGETCWYWGLKANAGTLVAGASEYGYGAIISALQNPSSSNTTQCDAVAVAVGHSSWGTGNFSSLCGDSLPDVAKAAAAMRSAEKVTPTANRLINA